MIKDYLDNFKKCHVHHGYAAATLIDRDYFNMLLSDLAHYRMCKPVKSFFLRTHYIPVASSGYQAFFLGLPMAELVYLTSVHSAL
jgi:hypothetical protein